MADRTPLQHEYDMGTAPEMKYPCFLVGNYPIYTFLNEITKLLYYLLNYFLWEVKGTSPKNLNPKQNRWS